MVHPDELLTIAETVEILKISRRTLERWRDNGTLIPAVIGGVIRYRREDIDALISRAAS